MVLSASVQVNLSKAFILDRYKSGSEESIRQCESGLDLTSTETGWLQKTASLGSRTGFLRNNLFTSVVSVKGILLTASSSPRVAKPPAHPASSPGLASRPRIVTSTFVWRSEVCCPPVRMSWLWRWTFHNLGHVPSRCSVRAGVSWSPCGQKAGWREHEEHPCWRFNAPPFPHWR